MNHSGEQRAKRRWPWVVLSLTIALGFAGAAIWWVAGRSFWTDGRELRLPTSDAEPRQVLWSAPQSLEPIYFNTIQDEYEPCLSPDGAEMYFVRGKAGANADIYVSYRRNNAWSEPKPLASVNSAGDDLGPRLTPDGNTLLFYSDRTGGQGQYDIWAATRTADGFGPAVNLGPNINSPFNDYSPAPSPDGQRLYFASNRAAAAKNPDGWRATIRQSELGDYDLYAANAQDAAPATGPTTRPALAYAPAVALPDINTPHHEGACCVSPGGDFLYFASNRPGGFGKFDLYRARIKPDGFVAKPENLGPQVNTPENETDPLAAANGFQLYFSSDRTGTRGGYDLWSADSREVFADRQARGMPHLGWSWWVLLAALLVLIPLLSFFRGWQDRRYSLLQKCLLISLLLHVLLTILFTGINVSQKILAQLKKEGGMELAVNLDVSREVEVGLSARNMISDLTAAPPPAPVPQRIETQIPVPPPAPPVPSKLSPAPVVRPSKIEIQTPQPPTPQIQPPTPQPVAIAPPQVQLPVPKLVAPQPTPVRAQDVELTPTPVAAPQLAPQRVEATVAGAPQQVRVEGLPVRPNTASLAQAVQTARPDLPVMDAPPPPTAQAPTPRMDFGPSLKPSVQQVAQAPAMEAPKVDASATAVPLAAGAPAAAPDIAKAADAPVNVRPMQPLDIAGSPALPQPIVPTLDVPKMLPAAELAMAPGPRDIGSPEAIMPRSFEQRQERIRKVGGSPESERAVARALMFLQRSQEPDGRWTVFNDLRQKRKEKNKHDTALTGLATLCFLGADHKPTDNGLHSQTVAKGLDYLIARQKPDGDLRNGGDMYDQGIATIALCEAAIMTKVPRYREAAEKAVRFIERAQTQRTGGWRYTPNQPDSDTSVFGWQVMAMRSAKTMGMQLDEKVWKNAIRYLESTSGGKTKILAGYQSNRDVTATMTAEAALCRVLLDMPFTPEQTHELGQFLLRELPKKGSHSNANYYFWYYGSLSLMHLQGDTWQKWNNVMRDHLIATQTTTGAAEGSWSHDARWASAGGRVYTTAMATLTLEVYYRFLPMYGRSAAGAKPPH